MPTRKDLSRLGSLLSATEVTLLRDGELGSLALGQRDPGLVTVTNNENVGDTKNS